MSTGNKPLQIRVKPSDYKKFSDGIEEVKSYSGVQLSDAQFGRYCILKTLNDFKKMNTSEKIKEMESIPQIIAMWDSFSMSNYDGKEKTETLIQTFKEGEK